MFNKLISFSLNEFCETFTISNYAKLAKYVDKLTDKIIVFILFLHTSSFRDKICGILEPPIHGIQVPLNVQ